MKLRELSIALFIALVTCLAIGDELPPPTSELELRDGERVALVGGTFIERMQIHGYLETLLTAAQPERDVVFRNLGWSGDNVWGHSRAVFGAPDKGFERLLRDVKLAAPTLILVHYGENEAHAGEEGLEQFRSGMNRLLDELGKATGARLVLLVPRRHENLGEPLPSQDVYNTKLDLYIAALYEIGKNRKLPLVDLNAVWPVDERKPITSNGVHLTAEGYQKIANRLSREFLGDVIPPYDIFDTKRGQELRQAIIAKNELFFHRHRPQNETYLFLFRKHEQGNNAVEVPQFDPLIESKEQEIARLRKG